MIVSKSRTLRTALALGAATVSLALCAPASAQEIVYDPQATARLIEQAQTGLKQLQQLQSQLDQARRLYDGFNRASGVNGLAKALSSPALRSVLPDASSYIAAAQGDLSALGKLGADARQVLAETGGAAPSPSTPQAQARQAEATRAARDLALGQSVADAGAQRLAGLEQLQGALDSAPTARAVMDLQARLAAEQALTANDQMRLSGLAMAQAAQDRLAAEQARRRLAAADAARLAFYRRGFP